MNLWDIVKNVGATALNIALPGSGSALLAAVNGMLGDGEQLPDSATGHDIQNALHKMPAEQRAELMGRQFDVDIKELEETHSSLRAALNADRDNPHTTRPAIAWWSFVFTAFFSGAVGLTVVGLWAYAVYTQNVELVDAVVAGWPFLLALIGSVTTTFAALLRAYFGMLTKEHKTRLNAAGGGNSTPSGIGGILSALLTKKG